MSHNAVRLLLMAVEAFRQRREALEFETQWYERPSHQ